MFLKIYLILSFKKSIKKIIKKNVFVLFFYLSYLSNEELFEINKLNKLIFKR